jgi:superfamily II DNA or RNA helicase
MINIEYKIQQLSKEVFSTQTKQKRIRKFDKYLKDWGISRLTSAKRDEIERLLIINNLEFIKPYTEDEKVDLSEIDKNSNIVLKYRENIEQNLDEIGKGLIDNFNRPIFRIAQGECPKKPYPFQEEAYRNLNKYFNWKENKKGLLVLPTGAGKTFTSVSWILRNIINENKKVIWVAHRHELLEQVKNEIGKLCYSNILPNKKQNKVLVHLVSGSHDRVNKINRTDDIIIASVQTLNRNLERLKKQFLKHNEEVFLVIDEAHHATARTYKSLINIIEENCNKFNVIGLTATPFRTADKEKSLLAKVFDPQTIFKKDLRELIINKILADPKFIPIETNQRFTKKDFSEKEIELLQSNFDLPEKIKKKIIERTDRNRLIVNHYVENKDKYKQTLVFALDQNHAMQLDALFKQRGVKSEFVISGTQSAIGINRDKEANKKAINDFRENKLDTLINVNILTEGTDLPNTQTVFLTRPTKSKTLMTQMVGRALRGEKAGGTEDAYIVSFIDNWSELVAWQSPEELFNDGIGVDPRPSSSIKYETQLISIELIQQFSHLADSFVDTTKLQNLPAIMRIPVGWYSFDLEYRLENEDIDYKSCKILVYQQHSEAFEELSKNIEKLYKRYDYDNNNILDQEEKLDFLNEIIRKYFDIIEYPEPKIQENDLLNLIDYYDIHRTMPNYFRFEDRNKYDISKLANEIINREFSRIEEADFIKKSWNGETGKSIWKEFYNNNFNYFRNEINFEIGRILYPSTDVEIPEIEYGQNMLEDMPLYEWPPKEYRQMLEAVFEKWNKENPKKRIEKKDRFKYDIDHKKAFNNEGKTRLENLEPLLRGDNKKKSDK